MEIIMNSYFLVWLDIVSFCFYQDSHLQLLFQRLVPEHLMQELRVNVLIKLVLVIRVKHGYCLCEMLLQVLSLLDLLLPVLLKLVFLVHSHPKILLYYLRLLAKSTHELETSLITCGMKTRLHQVENHKMFEGPQV